MTSQRWALQLFRENLSPTRISTFFKLAYINHDRNTHQNRQIDVVTLFYRGNHIFNIFNHSFNMLDTKFCLEQSQRRHLLPLNIRGLR